MKSPMPSPSLLAAALAGLCPACGDDAGEGSVTAVRVVDSLDAPTFDAECAKRDGVLQFHAHCGGVNACRGASYDDETHELTEHTCRGMNTCSGMSCVELSADRKREGAALYAELCASCHGEGGTFSLPIAASADPGAEEARYAAESTLAKSAAIAFGEDGAGLALSVKHAFYEALSRAEILRLVAHVDAQPIEVRPAPGAKGR